MKNSYLIGAFTVVSLAILLTVLPNIPSSVVIGFIFGFFISLLPFIICVYALAVYRKKAKDRKAMMDIEYNPVYVKTFERALKTLNIHLEKEAIAQTSLYSKIIKFSSIIDNCIKNMVAQKTVDDIENLGAPLLVSLLLRIVKELPSPILGIQKCKEWFDAAELCDSDKELAIHSMRKIITNLPAYNRHLLLLILRHIYTMSVNQKIIIQEMTVPWSEVLWIDMEPNGAGLKVLNAIISLQPELISAFALREREREKFHGALTLESRSMLNSLHIEHADVIAQILQMEENARFLTMMGSRWFMEYNDDVTLIQKITKQINKTLNTNGLPSFIESINPHSVHLGTLFPNLSKVRIYPTRPGTGEFAFSIMTKAKDGPGCSIDINFIIPITNIKVLVTLEVQLKKFEGRVWCFLPSPHEDKGYGWVGVEGEPDLAFKIELTVGYIPPKYLMLITNFVESKLKSGFFKDYVLPSWKRIEMPWKTKAINAEMGWAIESGLGSSDVLLQPTLIKVTKTETEKKNEKKGNEIVEIDHVWSTLTSKNTGKEVELQDIRSKRTGSLPERHGSTGNINTSSSNPATPLRMNDTRTSVSASNTPSRNNAKTDSHIQSVNQFL